MAASHHNVSSSPTTPRPIQLLANATGKEQVMGQVLATHVGNWDGGSATCFPSGLIQVPDIKINKKSFQNPIIPATLTGVE